MVRIYKQMRILLTISEQFQSNGYATFAYPCSTYFIIYSVIVSGLELKRESSALLIIVSSMFFTAEKSLLAQL